MGEGEQMTPEQYSQKIAYVLVGALTAFTLTTAAGLVYAFILKPLFTM